MARDFHPFDHSFPPPDACLLCAPDLTALFDGEADDVTTRRACAHLEGCPACAAAYRAWAQNRSMLRAVAPTPLPPTLPQRLLITCRLEGLAQARRRMRDISSPLDASLQGVSIEAPTSFDAPASLLPPRLTKLRRARQFAGAAALAVPVMAASLMLFVARAPQPTRPASRSSAGQAPVSVTPRLMAQLPSDSTPSDSTPSDSTPSDRAPLDVPSRLASRPQIAAPRRVGLHAQRAMPTTIALRPKSQTRRVLMRARVRLASLSAARRLKRATLAPQVVLADFDVAVRPRVRRAAFLAASLSGRAASRRRVRHQVGVALQATGASAVSPGTRRIPTSSRAAWDAAQAAKRAHASSVGNLTPIPRLAMAREKRAPVEAASENNETMFGSVGDDRPEELSQVVDNYRAALIADTDSQS